MGTQITREVDATLYTRCGIGGRRRRDEDVHRAGGAALPARAQARGDPRTLPQDEIEFILDRPARAAREDAGVPRRRRTRSTRSPSASTTQPFFLYLGRHIGLPVALEGALKLEGDLVHPDRRVLGRRDEARPDRAASRGDAGRRRRDEHPRLRQDRLEHPGDAGAGAHVIAIATDGNEDIQHHADDVIYVPRTPTSSRRRSRIPLPATFRAQGRPCVRGGDHGISGTLGCELSLAGDPVAGTTRATRTKRIPGAVRRHAYWALDSGLEQRETCRTTSSFSDAIDARREAFDAIRADCEIDVFCTLYSGDATRGGRSCGQICWHAWWSLIFG